MPVTLPYIVVTLTYIVVSCRIYVVYVYAYLRVFAAPIAVNEPRLLIARFVAVCSARKMAKLTLKGTLCLLAAFNICTGKSLRDMLDY